MYSMSILYCILMVNVESLYSLTLDLEPDTTGTPQGTSGVWVKT